MTPAPELGLLVDADPPPALTALVRALAPWCRPSATDPCATGPGATVAGRRAEAWLASSPDCRDLLTAAAHGRPLAIWVTDPAALRRALDLDVPVAALVTSAPEVAALHRQVVLFPRAGIDLSTTPALAPMVRARWRARLVLPDVLIVRAGDDHTSVSADLVPTGLALASAVVAQGRRWLLEALAWAAPCVTDADSAAALGLDGDGVVVETPANLDRAAGDLAHDERRAAAASHAGRRFVERAHDCHRPALEIARALRLTSEASDPVGARITAALDDLGAPGRSGVRQRALTLARTGGAESGR